MSRGGAPTPGSSEQSQRMQAVMGVCLLVILESCLHPLPTLCDPCLWHSSIFLYRMKNEQGRPSTLSLPSTMYGRPKYRMKDEQGGPSTQSLPSAMYGGPKCSHSSSDLKPRTNNVKPRGEFNPPLGQWYPALLDSGGSGSWCSECFSHLSDCVCPHIRDSARYIVF